MASQSRWGRPIRLGSLSTINANPVTSAGKGWENTCCPEDVKGLSSPMQGGVPCGHKHAAIEHGHKEGMPYVTHRPITGDPKLLQPLCSVRRIHFPSGGSFPFRALGSACIKSRIDQQESSQLLWSSSVKPFSSNVKKVSYSLAHRQRF